VLLVQRLTLNLARFPLLLVPIFKTCFGNSILSPTPTEWRRRKCPTEKASARQNPRLHLHNMQNYQSIVSSSQAPAPAPPKVEDESGNESLDQPKKRSRRRQQVSCHPCHSRKQKCDREQPCGRCVKVSANLGVISMCWLTISVLMAEGQS
jgi:hypothetical protein